MLLEPVNAQKGNSKVGTVKTGILATYSVPLVLSLCILAICYPGFMSYDSIRMLEEARSSVRGGIYPAAPVYILKFFDVAGYGPTLMLQAQNLVLLICVALILRMLGARITALTIAMVGLLAMPTVIGCMLVLWKDVTLTSLMMLSITIIFLASSTDKKNKYFEAGKWISMSLLMLGTLVRFNAITSTAVIAIYWISIYYKQRSAKFKGSAFVAILFCMVVGNKLVNTYSFPEFKKLEPNPIAYVIMTYDLVGTSGWSRDSLIPIESGTSEHLPRIPISDIDKIYSPLGALAMNDNNVRLGNTVRVYPAKYSNEDITKAWLEAIYNHPLAYLSYRWDLFSEIIGAKNHATFEPTHFGRIDENPFGIQFQDRSITNITLKYIQFASNTILGKPWFAFLLSFAAVMLILKCRFIRPEFKALSYYSSVSALLYILPFFIISGTGEVRYCFPAIVLSSISIFIWFFAHVLPRHDGRGQLSFDGNNRTNLVVDFASTKRSK